MRLREWKCCFRIDSIEICKAEFRQKVNLNTHIAKVHEEMKPFKCDLCNAKFTSKHSLNGHIAAVHYLCNAKFTQKPSLNRHNASA